MVQDLLNPPYVKRSAYLYIDDCAIPAMPELYLPHAFAVFAHRLALRTSVFQQSGVGAQVFTNEALPRSEAFECM